MTETELFLAYRRSPDHRRIAARARARARGTRRVGALLDYLADHPEATRFEDPELRRLDDLVGEAGRLVREL